MYKIQRYDILYETEITILQDLQCKIYKKNKGTCAQEEGNICLFLFMMILSRSRLEKKVSKTLDTNTSICLST